MTDISPPDPRRRLRDLLAIPERDRSDEQWDEIIELEISMAPGNREGGPDINVRRNGPAPGGERKPSGDRRPGGDRNNNKPAGGSPRPGGGDRQRNGGPRPGADRRPAGPPRSGAPRPGGDRPAGDRPAGDRPAGDRQQRQGGHRSGGGDRRPPAAVAAASVSGTDAPPSAVEQKPVVADAGVPSESAEPGKKPVRKFPKKPPKADVPEQ